MADLFELLSYGPSGWGDELVNGMLVSILVAVCSYSLGMAFGVIFSAMKLSNSFILKGIASAYTTVVRGIPELIVIYLVFFGSNVLAMSIAEGLFGYEGYIELPVFAAGVLCLALSSGAYLTEVLRGAVLAVPRGQLEAARAIGMPQFTFFLRILAPLAVRYAIVGMANVWIFTLKHTALLSLIGLSEVMRQAYVASSATQEPFTFYMAALVLYLIMISCSSKAFSIWESRAYQGTSR